MKQLKGVLFDFNGTLFFDSDMHMEAFRRAFPKYGQPVPSDEFMIGRCFGRTNDTIYRENFKPDPTPEEVSAAGRKLAEKQGRPVFVTLGGDGMLVFDRGEPQHVPTVVCEGPFDFCGAGDSASAGITLALALGASPAEAAALGNMVASVTIRKIGDDIKTRAEALTVLFSVTAGEKVTFAAFCTKAANARGVHAGNLVRGIAQLTGGNGGGRPDSAMSGAKDVTKVDEALAAAQGILAEMVK